MKSLLQNCSAACLVLALLACTASQQLKDAYEKFDLSVHSYAGAVRWGNYQEAASFCQPRLTKVKKPNWKRFENIQVTAYEIREKVLNPNIKEAFITMVFSYYLRDQGSVQTLVDEQTWWYDDKQRRWFVDGDVPEFPG
jgi:hypothetical protein